jgi:tetratricopeptide (TPR) repeat protein
MYSRKVKIVFAFMAFLMSVGYALLILSNVPSFRTAFGGGGSGRDSTKSAVSQAEDKVAKDHCAPGVKGHIKSECVDNLQTIAAGYGTLSQPDQGSTQTVPDAQHDTDKMVEAYKLAVEIDPNNKDLSAAYGAALTQTGHSKDAEPVFEKLLKSASDQPDYYLGLAQAAQSAGDTATAKTTLQTFLKKFPDDANASTAQDQLDQLNHPQSSGSSPISVGG